MVKEKLNIVDKVICCPECEKDHINVPLVIKVLKDRKVVECTLCKKRFEIEDII